MKWEVVFETEKAGAKVVVRAQDEAEARAAAQQWHDDNIDPADKRVYKITSVKVVK